MQIVVYLHTNSHQGYDNGTSNYMVKIRVSKVSACITQPHVMTLYSLPLFPLNIVIFPDGLLPLRIFETRYLDMVSACLRNQTPFGLVVHRPEFANETRNALPFTRVGTTFMIMEADVTQVGLMNIVCRGINRFRIHSARQQADGLWLGDVEDIANDLELNIPDDLKNIAEMLRQLVESLLEQGMEESKLPFVKPYKFEDCSWVSNRWCEILAMSLQEKQRMLELDSPLVRLELVQDWISDDLDQGHS